MTERVNFRSDNEAPVAPEVLAAIEGVNAGHAHAYGDDALSASLAARFGQVFETDVAVYPVVSGTAANALSHAQLAPPYGAIFCHEHSHSYCDECGAPEFFTGGARLVPLAGEHGRLDASTLADALAATGHHGDHECLPAALTLTQATECGTVYRPEEIAALAAVAREHGMGVHVDGARFANAVAFLGCSPADVTWRAGVDMLSFGATKNGGLAAEAVIVFDGAHARQLGRRRKRGGHLLSKMRYFSAQLQAFLDDDLWLALAGRANAAAARLAAGIRRNPALRLAHPVEANELFVHISAPLAEALGRRGFDFHRWPGTVDVHRLVCSWATTDEQVDAFLAAAGELAAA